MKKVLIGLLAAVSFGTLAADATADFSSSIASYCTVGQVSPGVMHMAGTTISTDTSAVVQVNNNEANIYKIRASNAGDFTSKPAGYTGTATMTTSLVVAGANPGNVASGAELNLANVGADTVSVSVAGTTDIAAIAGQYTAAAVVSCIAQ